MKFDFIVAMTSNRDWFYDLFSFLYPYLWFLHNSLSSPKFIHNVRDHKISVSDLITFSILEVCPVCLSLKQTICVLWTLPHILYEKEKNGYWSYIFNFCFISAKNKEAETGVIIFDFEEKIQKISYTYKDVMDMKTQPRYGDKVNSCINSKKSIAIPDLVEVNML